MSRTVVVTGASKGIGRAISLRLLEEGYTVLGIARSFGTFPLRNRRFTHFSIDLSDLEKLPIHLNKLSGKYPRVDAVVCNVGRGHYGELEQFSYHDIRSFMDLNFASHAYMVRAFLPAMKKRKKGDFVFIGSEAGLYGTQRGTLYCASKFALRGFAQALRQECAASGVRVSIINPGMVRTGFFDRLGVGPGKEKGNFLLPEEIAEAVVMVLSRRHGVVFDEINMTPLKKAVRFRSQRNVESDTMGD